MKTYNALLWDVKTRELTEVHIKEFEDIRTFLDCTTITGWSASKDIYAYVDDEGLLSDGNPVAAHWMSTEYKLIQPIKGNILFVNPITDPRGNTQPLTPKQIKRIKDIPKQVYYDIENEEIYPILHVIYEG